MALELCLLNAVLGGGSLNGKQFAYANKHATCGEETAFRKDWFESKLGALQDSSPGACIDVVIPSLLLPAESLQNARPTRRLHLVLHHR